MMRLQNATPAELQAAGIDATGMGSPRKDISTFLSSVAGVQNIAADGKSFRNAFEVLGDIAKQWSGYNGMQRSAIAEQLAGKNSANGFYSLMQNWDAVQKSYETGRNAQGSADRELANASDSVAFKMKQVQASLEDLSTNFLTSGMLKTGAMSLNTLIQGVNGVVKKVGGPGALGIALGGKDLISSIFTGQGFGSTVARAILGDENYVSGGGLTNIASIFKLIGAKAKSAIGANGLSKVGKTVAETATSVGADVSTSALKAIAKSAGNKVLRNGGTEAAAKSAANQAATQAAISGAGQVGDKTISANAGKFTSMRASISDAWGSLSNVGKVGLVAGGIVSAITIGTTIFKAIDKWKGLTVTQSLKNMKSSWDEYDDQTEKLSKTQQKIADNRDKIKEITGQEYESTADQAKVEKLTNQNKQLDIKQRVQQARKEQKQQQALNDTVHAYKKAYGTVDAVTDKDIKDQQKRAKQLEQSYGIRADTVTGKNPLADQINAYQNADTKKGKAKAEKALNNQLDNNLDYIEQLQKVGYNNLSTEQKAVYNGAMGNVDKIMQTLFSDNPSEYKNWKIGNAFDDFISRNSDAINKQLQPFDKDFNIGDFAGDWVGGLAQIAELTEGGKFSFKKLKGPLKKLITFFKNLGLDDWFPDIQGDVNDRIKQNRQAANKVKAGDEVAASNTDTVMSEQERRAEVKKNVQVAQAAASSGAGMTYQQATLMETQGFGGAIERTGNGIRLNQQKYNLLTQTQQQTELANKTDDLNAAYAEYYDNLDAINKLQNQIAQSGGKATDKQKQRLSTLNQSHRILAQNIENEKNALSSIGGDNSAVNRFLNAGTGASDVSDNIAKGASQVEKDIKAGRVSTDRVRQMVAMMNFQDTTGWSNKQVGENAKSSFQRMQRYGSLDKEGNFAFDINKTSAAIEQYQNQVRKAGNSSYNLFDKTHKTITATKQDIQNMARVWGTSESFVQQMLDQYQDYGWNSTTNDSMAKTMEQRRHDAEAETKALNENAKARKEYLGGKDLMTSSQLEDKYQAGKAATTTGNEAIQKGVRNDLNSQIEQINKGRQAAAAKGDTDATMKLNDALAQTLTTREKLDSYSKNPIMQIDPTKVKQSAQAMVSSVQEVQNAQNDLSVANQLRNQGIYADIDSAKGKVQTATQDLITDVQSALQSGDSQVQGSLSKLGLNASSSAEQIKSAFFGSDGALNPDALNTFAQALNLTAKLKLEPQVDSKDVQGAVDQAYKPDYSHYNQENGKKWVQQDYATPSSPNVSPTLKNTPYSTYNQQRQKNGQRWVQDDYATPSSPNVSPTITVNTKADTSGMDEDIDNAGKNKTVKVKVDYQAGQNWVKDDYSTQSSPNVSPTLKNTPYSTYGQQNGQKWVNSNYATPSSPNVSPTLKNTPYGKEETVTVNTKADTSGMEKDIDSAGKGKTVKVKVEPDYSSHYNTTKGQSWVNSNYATPSSPNVSPTLKNTPYSNYSQSNGQRWVNSNYATPSSPNVSPTLKNTPYGQQATTKVKVEADTSSLQSSIDSATQGKTAKVNTEADTSKLSASIDSAVKGKTVKVNVEPDYSSHYNTTKGQQWVNSDYATPSSPNVQPVLRNTPYSTSSKGGSSTTTPKTLQGKVKYTADFSGIKGKPKELKGKVKYTADMSGVKGKAKELKGKVKYTADMSGVKAKAKTLKGKVKYTADMSGVKGKAKTLKAKVNYTKGSQAPPSPKTTTVAYLLGSQTPPSPQSTTVNYALGHQDPPASMTATVNYVVGSVQGAPRMAAPAKGKAHPKYLGTAHRYGTASLTGHSFATGSATDDKDEKGSAYAGGRYTVGRNETALVNELGPELIVRGNQFFFANGGKPGFFPLKPNDIVFNKSQTSDLLTKGYTNTYAHAQGTVSGLALAKGSTKKSSDDSSSKKSGSSDDKQKVDWIDILTSRTQRVSTTFENAGKRLLAATNNFRLAVTHYDVSIQSQRRLIDQYTKATARYQQQADKVGLSPDLVTKVKNGTIDIGEYDDDTQKKISEYQQWYEKTLSCADAIEQARTQVHELNQEKLDAVTSSFENLRNVITSNRTLIEDQGALFEAFNGFGDNINVELQKDSLEQEMTNYRQEGEALQKTLDSLTDENGKPLDGMDQEVLATKAQIQDCNAKIIEAATDIKKLNDTRLDNITNQFKSLADLLDSITNKFSAYETLEKTMNGYVSSGTIDKENQALDNTYKNTADQQAEVNLELDRQQRELSQKNYDALKSQVDAKKKELANVTKQRDKVQAQITARDKAAQATTKTTAASGNSYKTRANYNMRETANGKRITTIPKGTTVQGTGKTSGDWTQVTYNGKTGYVLNRGLQQVAATPVSKATVGTAKTATAVKESATTTPVVKQSALNKITESVSEAVSVGAKQAVAKTATANTTPNSYQLTATYNMRKTAGGAKVGSIPKGTTVTATGKKSGNWTEVTYNGKTGYVYNKGLKQITVGQQTNTDGIKKTEKNQDALGQQLTEWNKQVVAKQTEVAQAQEEVSNFKVGFDVNGPDAKVKLANQAKTSKNTAVATLLGNRNEYYENQGKYYSGTMDKYNQDTAVNNAGISFLDKITSYITSNGGSISSYLPYYQKLYGKNNSLGQLAIQSMMSRAQQQAAEGTLTDANKVQVAQNILSIYGQMGDAVIDLAEKTKSADEEAEEHLSKIEQHYNALISLVDSYISRLQAQNELINKQTGYDDRQTIVSEIAAQEEKQKELNVSIAAEEAEMKNLKKGSTEWLNAAANVENYKTQLVQSKSAVEDLKKALRTLDWRHYDVGIAKNKQLLNEVDSVLGVMNNLNNFEYQSPNITANGITNLNLNAQGLLNSRKIIDDQTQAINKLNEEYAAGTINEKTYTEEMQEHTEKRYDAITSANKYRQAIISEVKDGIEQETAAMQKLINKRTDALSRLKAEHDYEQQISKSNKNISRIQAQINMLNGDDSQKANQRRRTLQNQLRDAQDDLQDQRDQHRYSVVTQGYNDELTAFQELQKKKEYALNDSVEAQDKIIQDTLKTSTAHYTETTQTLTTLLASFGVQASDSLTSPWKNAQTATETFKDAAQLDGVVHDIDLFPQETAEALTNPWEEGIKAGESFKEQTSDTVQACIQQLQELMAQAEQAISAIQNLSTISPNKVQKQAEDDANKKAGATVNRYYNSKTGQHLDTTSEKEKANLEKSGWSKDSVSWKETTDKNAVPVYRVRNPNNGDYLYTTSLGEKNSIVSKGWKDEGVSQYANSGDSGKPIYRLYNQKTGMHFFTSSVGEKNTREKQGWKDEGIAYYSGYAGGTYKAAKGTHLTDEKGLGSEVIITKNGALRQLDSGDRVFNDEQVKALWAMSKAPAAKFTPVHSSIPETAGKPITVTNNYGSLLTVNGNVDQETLPSLEEILKKASEQTRKDMVDSFRKYGINR